MKLLVVLLLNIIICITLNFVCIYIILQERIYPDTFRNPVIVFLMTTAIAIHAYIVYRILKYYDLLSKKSLAICMSGVVLTWASYLAITIF